jgi:hypothetical protein
MTEEAPSCHHGGYDLRTENWEDKKGRMKFNNYFWLAVGAKQSQWL